MDIRKLCPKYGDRLAFFGNTDVMKMATNDLAMIEDEVRAKMAAGKATKGYVYHSDHSIPPQVSWQTYQAIIRMVEKYRELRVKEFISSVSLAPDFARSIERFDAWWRGGVLDRPPVTIWVDPVRPYSGPRFLHHATQRERWLDGEFVVESAIATLEQRDYVGEAMPMFWANIGPELTATLYGCDLGFFAGFELVAPDRARTGAVEKDPADASQFRQSLLASMRKNDRPGDRALAGPVFCRHDRLAWQFRHSRRPTRSANPMRGTDRLPRTDRSRVPTCFRRLQPGAGTVLSEDSSGRLRLELLDALL